MSTLLAALHQQCAGVKLFSVCRKKALNVLRSPMLTTQGTPMSTERIGHTKLESQLGTTCNIQHRHGSDCSLNLGDNFAPRRHSGG
eukprot:7568308-Ditylum_brightwellii.AAC.1